MYNGDCALRSSFRFFFAISSMFHSVQSNLQDMMVYEKMFIVPLFIRWRSKESFGNLIRPILVAFLLPIPNISSYASIIHFYLGLLICLLTIWIRWMSLALLCTKGFSPPYCGRNHMCLGGLTSSPWHFSSHENKLKRGMIILHASRQSWS